MAVSKLSQIAAAGAPPAAGTQFVAVTGGNTDNLYTITQITAGLGAFTSTLQGVAPSSGGGTTNFLRADGTWTAPPSGSIGGTIASGSDTAVLFIHPANTLAQDVGAFAWNDTSKVLALTNTSGAANSAPLSISNQTTVVPAFHIQFTDLNFSDQTISTDGLGTLILQPSTSASGAVKVWNPTTTKPRIQVGLTTDSFAKIQFGLDASDLPQFGFGPGSSTRDTFITRGGPANIQFGLANNASPVAQTLSFQGQAGSNLGAAQGSSAYIQGPLTTGAGNPGYTVFTGSYQGQVPPQTFTITLGSPGTLSPANGGAGISGPQGPFLLTTTGALPTGLSTLTTFYLGQSATRFWAGDYDNGGYVNTSGTQSGVHTMSPGMVCTISNGSPAVVTGIQTDGVHQGQHTIGAGQPVIFQTTGTLPAPLVAGTTYYAMAQNMTAFTFQVAATLNGPAINTTSAGSGTHTVLFQSGLNTAPFAAFPASTGQGALGVFFGPPVISGNPSSYNVGFQVDTQWAGVPSNVGGFRINVTDVSPDPNIGSALFNLNYHAPSFSTNDCTIGIYNTGQWIFIAQNPNLSMSANGAAFTSVNIQAPGAGLAPFLAMGAGSTDLDVRLQREAAGTFSISNNLTSTLPASLRVYNTTSGEAAPTNYERGVFDFTTTSNTLTVGTQSGGTGTRRGMNFDAAGITVFLRSSGAMLWSNNGTANVMQLQMGGYSSLKLAGATSSFNQTPIEWGSGDCFSTSDTGLWRVFSGVVGIATTNGGGGTPQHDGWINYAGQTRVTSDFSVTSSTALTNVTGLTVNVQAGRTYTFEAVLLCTDAAAGGVQASISGTATITNLIYEGYTLDVNTVKGQTQATAFGTAVGSTTTTGTTPSIRIQGTITVNAAGTLTVQFAQNTSNGTASVVKRGSHFLVQDMP